MLFFPVALAYADGGGGGGGSLFGGGGIMNIAPLIILFVIFYFLLIRPQQKKAKEHKQMLSELTKGDSIVTNGGLYGRVTSVSDETLMVEISDGVRVKIARAAISMRKPQG
ncbi:MAG: preprotein translocase subunit YajC [Thermodesulfobacteriota bacterium]